MTLLERVGEPDYPSFIGSLIGGSLGKVSVGFLYGLGGTLGYLVAVWIGG